MFLPSGSPKAPTFLHYLRKRQGTVLCLSPKKPKDRGRFSVFPKKPKGRGRFSVFPQNSPKDSTKDREPSPVLENRKAKRQRTVPCLGELSPVFCASRVSKKGILSILPAVLYLPQQGEEAEGYNIHGNDGGADRGPGYDSR